MASCLPEIRRARRGWLLAAALSGGLTGCGDEPYPWEGAGPPPTAPPLPHSGGGEPSVAAVGPDPISRAPAGGLFVRCTEGLVAERDPVRDVMRLLLACGPSTGMTRLGDAPLEGALGPDSGPVSFDIRLKKGHCYRLFGAAGPGAEDLSVEIFSSRGTLIASDHRQDRLAVVQPDRPVCPPEDVDAQIVVLATGASAAFALEIATLALEGGH